MHARVPTPAWRSVASRVRNAACTQLQSHVHCSACRARHACAAPHSSAAPATGRMSGTWWPSRPCTGARHSSGSRRGASRRMQGIPHWPACPKAWQTAAAMQYPESLGSSCAPAVLRHALLHQALPHLPSRLVCMRAGACMRESGCGSAAECVQTTSMQPLAGRLAGCWAHLVCEGNGQDVVRRHTLHGQPHGNAGQGSRLRTRARARRMPCDRSPLQRAWLTR